jgi:hypothetical protein
MPPNDDRDHRQRERALTREIVQLKALLVRERARTAAAERRASLVEESERRAYRLAAAFPVRSRTDDAS